MQILRCVQVKGVTRIIAFTGKRGPRLKKPILLSLTIVCFFSLLGAGVSPSNDADGVIFPNDFVIFDEAHEMIDEASEHLGISISSWALESSLRRVLQSSKKKRATQKGGAIIGF